MRILMEHETQEINGAGILPTEIDEGLKILKKTRSVIGNAIWVFSLGYATGTLIYKGYEMAAGDSLGGDIYDLLHC